MQSSGGPALERGTRFQNCPRCKKRRKMRILRSLDEAGLVWLNCLTCNAILCFEQDAETGSLLHPEFVGIFGDPAPEDLRTYTPEGSYDLGEFIYHQTWRDVGKVIRRQDLAGGRTAIEVAFLNCGQKILIVEAEELVH